MLKDAQPFAHNCKLEGNGKPVELKSIWTFSFDAHTTSSGRHEHAARRRGSFDTTGEQHRRQRRDDQQPPGQRLPAQGDRRKGETRSLELHVGAPIDFHHGYGSAPARPSSSSTSNEAGCGEGRNRDAGALVPVPDRLHASRSAVCGRTYLDGKGAVSAQMKTV